MNRKRETTANILYETTHRRFKWLGIALCVLFQAGCNSTPVLMEPLSLVISGDTAGWIVPCGCTSNQSGGMARRGSFVQSLRSKGTVVVADVGGAAAGTSAYDRAKFEAILLGEQRMGVEAHNIGTVEAKLGAEYLRETATRLRVPFVSCNVADDKGRLFVDSHRLVHVAGRRILFVGVMTDQQAITGATIESPRAAVLKLLPTLQGKYDHLIVLAYLPEAELRALATSLPEADAVVGGPTGQSIVPEKMGPTTLAAATNKGKFLISLNVPANERIWTGAVHKLTEQIPDDREQKENLTAFHNLLAKRDFAANETSFGTADVGNFPSNYHIAGSDRCVNCHADACTVWKESKHAIAFQSLKTTGSHVDAYCQQCHTNGYSLPGGFDSIARSPQRISVGCEDCHGPASLHVAEPTVRTPFFLQAGQRCERCHDRENSPTFSFSSYWPRVLHGAKSP